MKIIYRILVLFSFFLPALCAQSVEKNSEFVVVIDAGHGGNDTGAVDNGVKEKDINLSVAKYLQEELQKKIKGIKVVMTRSNDTFVTLQGRADIANRNRADLFISIHTNSVDAKNPNRKSVAGTSVYALGLHKDKDNLNVAKRENSVIELEKNHEEKYSGFDPSKDESYIIFEMAQKKNLEQSLKFANFAQKQLVNKAGRKDRGVKQAGFWVLWATSMPAVLVELDFICNPTSAAFMGSTEGEKKMAEALSNAVVQYYNSIRPSLGEKRVSLNSTKKDNKPPVSQRYLAASESKNSVSSTRSAVSQKKSEADSENSKGELAVVTKSKRNDIPPKYNSTQENGRRTTTARKRRSASSKVASDRRNVETSSIVVKSENDYMAKVNEKKPAVKQEKKEVIKETPKERKKRLALEKKRKDKELKEKEALRKKEAKAREQQAKKEKENKEVQKNSSKNNKSNMKIVVNKDGSVAKTSSSRNVNSNSSSSVEVKKRKSLNSRKQ